MVGCRCILITTAPAAPWRDNAGQWTLGDLLSNFALTMNLTYNRPMLGPLWTLPLELQMYVALPLIFMLLGARKHPLVVLAMLVAAMAVADFQPLVSDRLGVAQFVPCFLGGVLAYTLTPRVRSSLPSWLWPLLLLAAVGCYCVFAPSPAEGNYAPKWLFCLVVGSTVPMFRDSRSVIVNTMSHVIATYSYGIYLLHYIALWIGCVVLAKQPIPAQWSEATVILVVACAASYHLIEKPAVGVGAALARRNPPVAAGKVAALRS